MNQDGTLNEVDSSPLPLPSVENSFSLRVQPDILPVGCVHIGTCWVNGEAYFDFNADAMTVKLPVAQSELKVKVQIVPNIDT